MKDLELLTFAAKAAGDAPSGIAYASLIGRGWDPLTDDGHALRLAVKLDFHVGPQSVEVWRNGKEVLNIFEDGADKHAATRRAIVRAAAEIWKAMP